VRTFQLRAGQDADEALQGEWVRAVLYRGCSLPVLGVVEVTTMAKFEQFNDRETSTRVCPCGAQITWGGYSDELESWMAVHSKHVDSPAPDCRDVEGDGEAGE
jgi:hypothetical protein